MIVGKVVGSVVSTRKSEKLIGQKFYDCRAGASYEIRTQPDCAIDMIGAGIGVCIGGTR